MQPERLAILVPTRARPESLTRLAENLLQTLARPEWVSLWLYADEGDEASRRFVADWPSDSPLAVRGVFEPDRPTQGQRYNRLRACLPERPELYLIGSDKMIFRTQGWDEVVRRAYRAVPDRLMMAFPKDSINHGQFGAFPILSEAWAEATGKLTTGHFPFWYDDTWLNEVAKMAGRWRALPIELEMASGSTQRMFHLRFWEHFFQATLGARLDEAKALLRRIHREDPVALSQAMKQAERLCGQLAISEADWPKRHQQLDAYERNLSSRRASAEPVPPPGDVYWEVEAAARAHLSQQAASSEDPELKKATVLALAHGAPTAEAQLKALAEAFAAGREGEALQVLAQHNAAFPFRPEAYELWARHLIQGGRHGEAQEVLQSAGLLFPGLSVWAALGAGLAKAPQAPLAPPSQAPDAPGVVGPWRRVRVSDWQPLDEATLGRMRALGQQVKALVEGRRAHIARHQLDLAIALPAANWEDGEHNDIQKAYEAVVSGEEQVLQQLRLYSMVFTGYCLREFKRNDATTRSVVHLPSDFDAQLDGLPLKPDMWAELAWAQQQSWPERCHIQLPQALGELGWWRDGRIHHHDQAVYQERLALLWASGLLEGLQVKLQAGEPVRVLEIGGGYGGLAHGLSPHLPQASYVICDLPESLAFSTAYLAATRPDWGHQVHPDQSPPELRPQGFTYLSNVMADALEAHAGGFDLVINTLSMSEMSEAQVRHYARLIARLLRPEGRFFEQNQDNRHLGLNYCKLYLQDHLRPVAEVKLPGTVPQSQGAAHLWAAP